VTIAVGAAVFFGASYALGVNEVTEVLDIVRRKIRR